MINRRTWIEQAAGGAALALGLPALSAFRFPPAPKRILVLGGTSFLGPALTDSALAAGHSVTLFNRGITNPGMFPYLERLRGYRDPDPSQESYAALGQRHWDAIIDVWPNDPALAENAARVLHDRTPHYLYVSSVAAYRGRALGQPGTTESGELSPWDPAIGGYNRGKA